MADLAAIQLTARVIDEAGKLAFHCKRQRLCLGDVVAASGLQGYGGAAPILLLHIPDVDLLYRFEAELITAEVCQPPVVLETFVFVPMPFHGSNLLLAMPADGECPTTAICTAGGGRCSALACCGWSATGYS